MVAKYLSRGYGIRWFRSSSACRSSNRWMILVRLIVTQICKRGYNPISMSQSILVWCKWCPLDSLEISPSQCLSIADPRNKAKDRFIPAYSQVLGEVVCPEILILSQIYHFCSPASTSRDRSKSDLLFSCFLTQVGCYHCVCCYICGNSNPRLRGGARTSGAPAGPFIDKAHCSTPCCLEAQDGIFLLPCLL